MFFYCLVGGAELARSGVGVWLCWGGGGGGGAFFGVFSGLFTDAEVGGSGSLEEKQLFNPKNGAGKSGLWLVPGASVNPR